MSINRQLQKASIDLTKNMAKAYSLAVVFLVIGTIHAHAPEHLTRIGEKFLRFPLPWRREPENKPTNINSDIKGRLLTPEEGCGYTAVGNNKIVGGTEAKIGAFPWIALLAYADEDPGYFNFECGGSLITSRHVLSAAHCIDKHLEFVRLGEHDITTTSDGPHQDIDVHLAVSHAGYNDYDKRNDIALLFLAHDVKFSDRIRPICVATEGPIHLASFVGSNPFVAGWGSLKENGSASDVLMQVQVSVHENIVCKEAFRRMNELMHEDQFDTAVLCAGNLKGGEDSCQGDSGGPLMLPQHVDGKFPFYQIGVVSYGIGCGEKATPAAYVNIQHFVGWIQNILANVTLP